MHPTEYDLLAYVEGDPSDPTVSEHVSTCTECAETVRRLEVARDALRAAPLLELPEERRKAIVAALPARRERWAPFRERLGPAAAAAAALLLVAGIVALATLAGGGGGGGEEGAGVGAGGGGARQAETAAGGATTSPQTTQAATLEKDYGAPVRRVRGSAEDVVRLLRQHGIPAVQRDGSVVAVGDAADVRLALRDRSPGAVAVYVR